MRARRSDIPLLATHFLRKYAEENGQPIEGFSDAALRSLMSRPWPGNVRELENTVERAVVLCTKEHIEAEDLTPTDYQPAGTNGLDLLVPGVTMEEVERLVIERTLDAVGGSTAEASKILGISRRKIQYRLAAWNGTDPEES